MLKVSIVDIRKSLARYLSMVSKGGEVLILRRNTPIAKIIGLNVSRPNKTRLGCGKGTVLNLVSPTKPFLSESAWEMLSPGK